MQILNRDELPWDGSSHELVGSDHGLEISLILVDAEPGRRVAPHRHPYAEVFIVQKGHATFTIDGELHEARAGDILVAHAGEAHAFVNSGTEPLRQIDIHLSATFSTEWLEERDS